MKVCGFYKINIVDFQDLIKIEFCWRLFFEILIIYKPLWGHLRTYTKLWPDRFSRFDVYWIQTDKQTPGLIVLIELLVFATNS